jgi:hypothetical protein
MPSVLVNLSGAGPYWTQPCRDAVTHLNALFHRHHINVSLTLAGTNHAATITVTPDPSLQGLLVHGRTQARFNGNTLLSADVKLPPQVQINTPRALRDAGNGVREVIAAHEFVHALGQNGHDSDLMTQTWQKEAGSNAAGDRLRAGAHAMPPLVLSGDTVNVLKGRWP